MTHRDKKYVIRFMVLVWIGLTTAGLIIDWDLFSVLYFNTPPTPENSLREFVGLSEPWYEVVGRYLRFFVHILFLEYSYLTENTAGQIPRIAILVVTPITLAVLYVSRGKYAPARRPNSGSPHTISAPRVGALLLLGGLSAILWVTWPLVHDSVIQGLYDPNSDSAPFGTDTPLIYSIIYFVLTGGVSLLISLMIWNWGSWPKKRRRKGKKRRK